MVVDITLNDKCYRGGSTYEYTFKGKKKKATHMAVRIHTKESMETFVKNLNPKEVAIVSFHIIHIEK